MWFLLLDAWYIRKVSRYILNMELTYSLLLSVYGVRIYIYTYTSSITHHYAKRVDAQNFAVWSNCSKEPKWKKIDCSVFDFAACLRIFFFSYEARILLVAARNVEPCEPLEKKKKKKKNTRPTNKQTHTQYKCVRMYTNFKNWVLFCFVLGIEHRFARVLINLKQSIFLKTQFKKNYELEIIWNYIM